MEKWKLVHDNPDYEISNYGRVRTLARMVRYTHAVTGEEHFRQTEHKDMMTYLTKWKYPFVMLRYNGKPKNRTIHRLVASAFLPNPNNLPVVNHKDGIKTNNHVDNLEWCTDAYNHQHATENNLKPSGERVGTSKLNEKCVVAIKRLLKMGMPHGEIAKLFDISRTNICQINTGKTWTRING